MPLSDVQLLQLAREGARGRIEELRNEIATLEKLIGGSRPQGALMTAQRGAKPRIRRRRRLSATARARIAAAQGARWAKIKQGQDEAKTNSSSAPARRTRKRRGMSAVQRAAVSRRMKAYWAKRRVAKTKK